MTYLLGSYQERPERLGLQSGAHQLSEIHRISFDIAYQDDRFLFDFVLFFFFMCGAIDVLPWILERTQIYRQNNRSLQISYKIIIIN